VRRFSIAPILALLALPLAACGGGTGGATPIPGGSPVVTATPAPNATGTPGPTASPTPAGTHSPTPVPTASPTATPTPQPSVAGIAAATGFAVSAIASLGSPRELAFLPNGDLLVGTSGSNLMLVPHPDVPTTAGTPVTFYSASEGPAAGVAYGPDGNIYFGTQHGVWKLAYKSGDQSEPAGSAVRIATIRTSTAREDHVTTSIAVSNTTVYASVGSSSNDTWPEIDATRATIQMIPIGSTAMSTRAAQVRNGIGLAIDPATNHLWVAGAGQDSTAYGHPYEYADDVDAHAGTANYGWPFCEENHVQYRTGMDCSQQAVPLVEFPAYSTHIGLTFYPASATGPYAFPAHYRGGLFVTSHGSWHCCPASLPNVAFVPMSGDTPIAPVNWSDPTVQWETFLHAPGDASGSTSYFARPTGIAVGPQGSLFVADDQRGVIYRIRPQ
jgi:glucose/arabinose dehydrogenase